MTVTAASVSDVSRVAGESHGPIAVWTHVTRRGQRFFDHILASSHFAIVESEYIHDGRESGLSDHSAASVRLTPCRHAQHFITTARRLE